MIIQAVTDQLPTPESAAVIGSYTHNSVHKAEAVRYLSGYLRPATTDSRQRLLFDYCVLRSLPKHSTQNVKSERQLLKLGVSDRSAAAYYREIRKRVGVLCKLGEDRMDAIFKEHGVINAE